MQQLAETALKLWPLNTRSVTLAAHRENAVFRIEAAEGRFALRLHRKEYRSDVELKSELQFMAAMAQQGLRVPEPLMSRNGKPVEYEDGFQVSVLSWLPGRPLGQSGVPLALDNRSGTFRAFGELIAKTHNLSDDWERPRGFSRKPWGLDGLLGESPQWGRFWESPHLTADQKTILIKARQKLRNELVSSARDEGLIHADLVSENILIDEKNLAIIDFDDSGHGYRLQDIATALVKHEAEPDFKALRQALCEGYMLHRPLQTEAVDTFLLIRHLSYIGWIVDRMGDEAGMVRCRRFIANGVAKAEGYLNQ